MAIPPDLLTVARAAEELGLSPHTVRGAIMRGVLKVIRLDGRTNLIHRDEVERYRAEHLGQHGKRPRAEGAPKYQRYQREYYQRRKAARRQPAAEPEE